MALQMILNRYAPHLRPGTDYQAITDAELSRTTVFKLHIEEWVGKEKQESEDFPGAFEFGQGRPGLG